MRHEFIIMDASIKYMAAKNPLEEGLLYIAEGDWSRDINKAAKFTDSNAAVEIAKKLQADAPVKILALQLNGNQIIGLGEVKF